MRVEGPIAEFTLRGGRTARLVAWSCAVAMVLAIGGGRVALTLTGPLFLLAFFGLLASLIVAIAQRGASLGVLRGRARGVVELDDERLRVRLDAREIVVPKREIVAGIREEIGAQHQVTLELPGGRGLAVRVADAAEGDALLDAAEVGPRKRSLSLRVGAVQTAFGRFVLATLLVTSVLVALPTSISSVVLLGSRSEFVGSALELSLAICGLSWLVLLLTSGALRTRHLTIGRDGVRVQAAMTDDAFLGFGTMDVRARERDVVLTADGRRRTVVTTSREEAASIVARIEAARAAFRERRATQLELLARGDRDGARWRADLAALVAAPDYRASMDPGDVAALLEDPAAPPEQRIGAALALSSLPEDRAERARVRVAIETTANPKLRVALERAARGEVDEAMQYARAR